MVSMLVLGHPGTGWRSGLMPGGMTAPAAGIVGHDLDFDPAIVDASHYVRSLSK